MRAEERDYESLTLCLAASLHSQIAGSVPIPYGFDEMNTHQCGGTFVAVFGESSTGSSY